MRTVFALAAAMCVCGAANAAAEAWNFDFANVIKTNDRTPQLVRPIHVEGTFVAEDLNHDNQFELSEVSQLSVRDLELRSLILPVAPSVPIPSFVVDHPSSLWTSLGAFRFDKGASTLEIAFFTGSTDRTLIYVDTINGHSGYNMQSESWTLDFSEAVLTAAPVPEPATTALSLVGLAAVMSRGRTKRRRDH
ncbi:hypothetical protein [Ideonella sp. BN130291]|uniref:hypothetical protein n=1 Tax=Ideonella sp. BN130291 TaxID=3112940 RepID=UPI002E25A13D|nr:hypothetical protein [Ideonella sp. BN130291]